MACRLHQYVGKWERYIMTYYATSFTNLMATLFCYPIATACTPEHTVMLPKSRLTRVVMLVAMVFEKVKRYE